MSKLITRNKEKSNIIIEEEEGEKRCLICNSKLKKVVEFYNVNGVLKCLSNIYNIPCKMQSKNAAETDTTPQVDVLQLEACETNPLCSICRTHVDEFFRNEKQVNELIRQMMKLKHGLGTLIVDTFAATSSQIKNYSLKEQIYEKWFPEVHGLPPVPLYQNHLKLLSERKPPPKLPNLITTPKKQSITLSPKPVVLLPSVSNPVEKDSEEVYIDESTPMPSPSSVGRVDSDMEDNITSKEGLNLDKVVDLEDSNAKTAQKNENITESAIVQEEGLTKTNTSTAKVYACPFCDKKIQGLSKRNLHIRTHTGDKPFACKYCEKMFSDNGNRKHHERGCKMGPQDEQVPVPVPRKKGKPKAPPTRIIVRKRTADTVYNCPHCETEWKTLFTLKVHVEQTHPGKNPFKCINCDRTFADFGNKSKHEKTHDKSRLTAPPTLECDICKKMFRLPHTLYHHRRKAHFGVKYEKYSHNYRKTPCSCDICGKTFLYRFKLNGHKYLKHDLKYSTPCAICGKPCTTQNHAKRHEETHKPNFNHAVLSQYQCPECPNHLGCSRKDNLRQHFRTTHPNIPLPKFLEYKKKRTMYPCPSCPEEQNVKFFSTKALKRHIKKHHTGKNPPPYKGPKNKKQFKVAAKRRGIEIDTDDDEEESDNLEFDDSSTSDNDDDSEAEETLNKSYRKKVGLPKAKKFKPNQRRNIVSLYRTRMKTKLKTVRFADSSSTIPVELKTLKIHLPRVDDPLADVQVKEEVIEPDPPSIIISDVYSVVQETDENDESRTKPIPVMSLSQIASFLNPNGN